MMCAAACLSLAPVFLAAFAEIDVAAGGETAQRENCIGAFDAVHVEGARRNIGQVCVFVLSSALFGVQT